jgi:hypothetical protein
VVGRKIGLERVKGLSPEVTLKKTLPHHHSRANSLLTAQIVSSNTAYIIYLGFTLTFCHQGFAFKF